MALVTYDLKIIVIGSTVKVVSTSMSYFYNCNATSSALLILYLYIYSCNSA